MSLEARCGVVLQLARVRERSSSSRSGTVTPQRDPDCGSPRPSVFVASQAAAAKGVCRNHRGHDQARFSHAAREYEKRTPAPHTKQNDKKPAAAPHEERGCDKFGEDEGERDDHERPEDVRIVEQPFARSK